ncbi:hypothetical protein N7462_009173 [Penicillium macrosclerotiorum]|uniref:uncharacterized protein n=1 Tax=Penicillium macrosclerotiorum TaxID=303699 RepID=UPI002547CC5D|nr:uncharacterized protein N7462_009173 [Penicillium macrosclerotiorum]KAJ5673734.1 hypothetical protein N7462_009173 [Penicillium macrosclerotiorum]
MAGLAGLAESGRSPGEVLTNSQRRTRILAAKQGTDIPNKWREAPEHAEDQVTWGFWSRQVVKYKSTGEVVQDYCACRKT